MKILAYIPAFLQPNYPKFSVINKFLNIFTFILFLFSCSNPKQNSKSILLKNLIPVTKSPIYIFSYPGREVHESKKRYVLDYLLKKIQTSQNKIEIYAYSFNHPEIIEALKEAKQRGVKISFLLDSEKKYTELEENGFEYRIWKSSGLHHIKAILFDSNSIFFGTGNFSKLGLTHDWNGYMDIPLEFEEYSSLQAELEIKKSDFLVKANQFQFLFSPQKGLLIQDKIFQEIEKAKWKVQVLSFDHFDPIFSHVLKKASARGVKVEIVQNKPLDEEGKYLQEELFWGESQVYEDGNTDRVFQANSNFPEAGLLHHKTILIDEEILLTGSYNYSLSARDKNRELFVFTKERTAIMEFTKEFERIREKSYPKIMSYSNHHFLNKNEFQNLNFPKTCYPQEIPSGVWEVGEGIFFSYLYFSKKSSCFEYSKRNDISSGLASFSLKEKEMQDLWKKWSFYPRSGSETYLENSFQELPNSDWLDLKVKELPLFYYELEFQKHLQNFKIYIPDYGLVESAQFVEEYKWKFSIGKKISEFLIFFEDGNKIFFTCASKEKPSKKLEFLLGKLFLKSQVKQAKSCISF
ncbi:MAG: phospholipase D-like domain-containing protein [Leptospiraceae bacterium]|nr:phospholipase D-like domain-containing protein [Leptospiraceae bacterium]